MPKNHISSKIKISLARHGWLGRRLSFAPRGNWWTFFLKMSYDDGEDDDGDGDVDYGEDDDGEYDGRLTHTF